MDVDVVVFSTQTSGLAAVRELNVGAPHLKVALISCGNLLETPLAQGLSVEDVRDVGRVKGGFYDEWRQSVIDSYARRGLKAFTSGGRFVYEPEVATQVLWSYVSGPKSGNTIFYSARLLAAGDQTAQHYVDVQVEGGGVLRINTRFFIDASVEGDLARMLGADYRIGRSEVVYNDVAGVKPAYPSADNGYETAPQRFSPLLTLKVYPNGNAPRIATFVHPSYDPATYAGLAAFSQKNVTAFKSSWTMTIAALPNGKRELNETWNDWPDVGLAFQWVFYPGEAGRNQAAGAGVVDKPCSLPAGARIPQRGDRLRAAEAVCSRGAARRGARYLFGGRPPNRSLPPPCGPRLLRGIRPARCLLPHSR